MIIYPDGREPIHNGGALATELTRVPALHVAGINIYRAPPGRRIIEEEGFQRVGFLREA